MNDRPKTSIYIDGFNLYYGCLRDSPFRWLDLEKLCDVLLPRNRVTAIKYFTAKVGARPGGDGQKSQRQEVYLRALRTLPRIEVIMGSFLARPQRLPLAESLATEKTKFVEVMRTEEKGSDVNLATHLVHDGHLNAYEVAVLITNDSDLAEPMRIVKEAIGKPVGLVNPHPRRASVRLALHAAFVKEIRPNHLAQSQFPETLHDAKGHPISRPEAWG